MSANIDNLKATLAILKRARKLDMAAFQNGDEWAGITADQIAKTEEELHTCGNTACIAGYVAVSAEWRAWGGLIDLENGSPYSKTDSVTSSLAEFWGLGVADTVAIIYGEGWSRFLKKYKISGIALYDEDSWDSLNKEQAVSLFEQLVKHYETLGERHADSPTNL